MTGRGAEERTRDIVIAVVAEALRVREGSGVIVGAPPSAERALLVGWLEGAGVPWAIPDPQRVLRVARALEDASPNDSGGTAVGPEPFVELAAFTVASARAVRDASLVAGVETRTHLLLDGARAAILPLGDLPATVVRDWAGGVRTPAALVPFDGRGSLDAVDRALASFLDEGRGMEEALHPLPDALRRVLERILRRGAPDTRGPLVPKLGRWTPGVDLAL